MTCSGVCHRVAYMVKGSKDLCGGRRELLSHTATAHSEKEAVKL